MIQWVQGSGLGMGKIRAIKVNFEAGRKGIEGVGIDIILSRAKYFIRDLANRFIYPGHDAA